MIGKTKANNGGMETRCKIAEIAVIARDRKNQNLTTEALRHGEQRRSNFYHLLPLITLIGNAV